jgi:hypothetical protein
MNSNLQTSEYLLLFRGAGWEKSLSPQELETLMKQWVSWYDGLLAQGKVKGANPLFPQGKIVSGKKGAIVADGPFAESKEAIGGYFLIEASSLDEAIEIAQGWPILSVGAQVEVRPVAASCPVFFEVDPGACRRQPEAAAVGERA